MKPNSMSKILVLGVFVLFLLSLGACNIKSLGIQIGEEPGPVVVAKSNSKAAHLHMPQLMVIEQNIPIATIPRAMSISIFPESSTFTWLGMVGRCRHRFRQACAYNSVTM